MIRTPCAGLATSKCSTCMAGIAPCSSGCQPALGPSLQRQGRQHLPLSRQLVVGVVAAADAEAEELAGCALDLLPLGLHGALQELVAVLQVPVVAPVLVDAPDGQEVVAGETLHK